MTLTSATVSAAVALASLVVAIVAAASSRSRANAKAEGRISEVLTKLDFIADDLKEIKANYRKMADELQNVRDMAVAARESAKNAHKRLDYMEEHHIGGTQ